MARETIKQALREKQDPAAPFLFDEDSLPIREDVVEAIRTEAYRHTGARLLDNQEKALRLVELLMSGWGVKRIAKEMEVSVHSIRAARQVLVSQGKLAPYKERVVRLFEEIVETGATKYLDALERGHVQAAQIPVGIGIISDKRALALGEPTAIGVVGATALDAKSLSVQALNEWVDSLPAVVPAAPAAVADRQVQAIDAPSIALPPKPPEKQ